MITYILCSQLFMFKTVCTIDITIRSHIVLAVLLQTWWMMCPDSTPRLSMRDALRDAHDLVRIWVIYYNMCSGCIWYTSWHIIGKCRHELWHEVRCKKESVNDSKRWKYSCWRSDDDDYLPPQVRPSTCCVET